MNFVAISIDQPLPNLNTPVMMIYGIKIKIVANEAIFNPCPNCNAVNSIQLQVLQRYFHVFWIPFFPIGKKGYSKCNTCDEVLPPKAMPATMQLAYANAKANGKTAWWMYSGLIALLAIAVWAVQVHQQTKKNSIALIAAPKKGDVISLHTRAGEYTLYKVADVKGDTVQVLVSNYATNKPHYLYRVKALGDTAYMRSTYYFTKAKLKSMLEEGKILWIDRDE